MGNLTLIQPWSLRPQQPPFWLQSKNSSTEKSFHWRPTDEPVGGINRHRVSESTHPQSFNIETGGEQLPTLTPEQASLHESEGSIGNSRSSTQMNSYSDSGYQEAGSYYSSQILIKTNPRSLQETVHSSTNSNHLMRNSRPEGQTVGQAPMNVAVTSNRAMRRVSSVPSRTQSPAYGTGMSPSRGSLRTSLGSAYGSPALTEPRSNNSAVYLSSTLPAQRAGSPHTTQRSTSPAIIRRIGSVTRQPTNSSRAASPYQTLGSSLRVGSPLTLATAQTRINSPPPAQTGSSSPARSTMTAVPQRMATPLQRSHAIDTEFYCLQSPEIYERMILPRPDSLAGLFCDNKKYSTFQAKVYFGLRSSYASQHSQLGHDLRSAMSPDLHITPIYEGKTLQSPVYRSPSHAGVELLHGTQTALFRTGSAIGNLQRSASQRSTMTYQRSNFALNSLGSYGDPYRAVPYRPSESNYSRLHYTIPADETTTRSPSIDSIQKDPREFAWRDPELPEVIHMLQHQFPSVQANAAAYLQHLCFGDNKVKTEVCLLGGIKHLVDLLDHKVLEVHKNACGALRNLVYGRTTDENKIAVKNAGGIPALLRLLRKTVDAEMRELITGVLWNLSSCDAVKMPIIRDALTTLTNSVVIPHSGWSSSSFDEDRKVKFHTSLVLRNTTGCLRNLSSAGEEARKKIRSCEGLVDSLLYVIQMCVNTADYDSKTVENCVCILRNLSYRLELEVPQARLMGTSELDGLLGSDSPNKDAETGCWGKKKKKKKKEPQEDQWDGVGPIPGFSKSPKGVEMLWHPSIVKPYLTLLAESSNPATLEGSAGSLQNLSAGNWKWAAYIRAAVRKEKGLPILVELLRMDNDRVVCSVATALRNMALDVRNKELIGKYAMRDLVHRLPGGPTLIMLSDDTVAAVCCALHEVTIKNMENAKALADAGGVEKLVNITRGKGERYSLKVVKAAAQVLNTLWQYRDLRSIYRKDGWNQNHFITPISTLERDRHKFSTSHPSLSTTNQNMSPVLQSVASTTSSPALLGIKDQRSNYEKTKTSMQYYNSQGDNMMHTDLTIGSSKPSPIYIGSYSSPAREESRRLHHPQMYYSQEDSSKRNYDTYRMYMQSPHSYEDPYFDDQIHYPTATDYTSQRGLKTSTNYVDLYSTTRPLYRADQYPGSPDSWV
ncbi:plakophilin-4 isoform X2 [Heterodontus francisci]|uniref:plakophilin-4 isoform X2 n=1 Tax=Heterodontus francisci TaxID=7792 RepID=UPI00355C2FE1